MKVSGQLHAPVTLPPRKEHPLPIGYEAGWAPEPVWTWCRTEKFPALSGNRTRYTATLRTFNYYGLQL